MVSCGIIGYGYWGPNLARNVSEAAGAELSAISDMQQAALDRAGSRYPGVSLHRNWLDMISDPKIDAVLVATPVSSHFEIALAALQAGKHVLVEKPITTTSAEARTLIEEADRRGLILMVDHTFVYTPAVRKIRELIVDGSLGDIYYYDSTRVNLGLFQSDVNVIWDLAVHDFSILEFLLDKRPAAISASGSSHIEGRPENIAHLTLFFESGTVAHLNVNWLAPVKVRQTLIGGSRKMIVYDDMQNSEKIKVYDRGVDVISDTELMKQMRVSYRMGDMWAPQLSVREALLTEITHFVECIEQGKRPDTSGENGLSVVEMLEAAMKSTRSRGAPVELGQCRGE